MTDYNKMVIMYYFILIKKIIVQADDEAFTIDCLINFTQCCLEPICHFQSECEDDSENEVS